MYIYIYNSYYNIAPSYLCDLISIKEKLCEYSAGELIIISLLCRQLVKIVQTLFLNFHSFMLLHANGTN